MGSAIAQVEYFTGFPGTLQSKSRENKKLTKTEMIRHMLICILDGNNITHREILHDTLADSLQLPDWYGRNLDALYDCLSDIREETEIRLLHEKALESHLGYYAEAFKKAVYRACRENPRIHFISCVKADSGL